jgi:DNA repair exonuclease SbcCD ATPase subunit
MILKRLKLTHYRGLDSCDVEFSPKGLTVVEGPNEVGKTCLAEALRIVIDYPDNSRHREILNIKPVHQDEGAEIEVELEVGETKFTYIKRFHKKPKTELRITSPRPETLTGREAHGRVKTLLEAEIDMDLWRALNIEQGQSLTAPDFSKQYSLSAALETAAGGTATDAEAESIFERAKKEFVLYYTPEKGLEGKDLHLFGNREGSRGPSEEAPGYGEGC